MKEQRYTIVRELGAGTFATVYLARDEKLNRDVAIKVFHKKNTAEALTRFGREALICTKLRHPNIIQIYDASIQSEEPKIIMEYINAGDLRELMERRSLSIEESLSIIDDIGSALEYLHQMNILHRDLKPANIMIQEPLKAILMDFNLAFCENLTKLTEEGCVVGTPNFMAPELFFGEPASNKSDIFSLGLILYDLVSKGKISSYPISISKLANRIIEAPSLSNREVSRELDKLVLWATASNVENRCPSMSEFLSLLREIRASEAPCEEVKRSLKSKDNRRPRVEAISVEDKRDPLTEKPPLKRRRTIGAAIAFLICLFVLIHSKFSEPNGVNLKDPNLSHENSLLIDLAIKCDQKPLGVHNFNLFVSEERKLFSKNKDSLILLKGHCNTLRSILDKLEQGTPFSCFVESRFRLRQETGLNEVPLENLKGKSTKLLHKCNELYWNELKKSDSPTGPQDLTTANLILFELWQQIKSHKELADRITTELMDEFSGLLESTRRTNEGKAFFHSLILCKLFNDRKIIPEDSTVFLIKPPYENEYLRALRQALIKNVATNNEPPSVSVEQNVSLEQTVSLEQNFHRLEAMSFSFLHEIGMKKETIKLTEPRRNPFGFIKPNLIVSDDWETNFKSLMENYVQHINQGWFIFNLAEDKMQWDAFLIMAIRDSMKYSWYGLHPTFSSSLEKMGPLNPVSLYFKDTNSKIWIKAALHHVRNSQWTNLGFTVYNFSIILRDVASLNDPQLKVRFIDFTKEVSKMSKETGLALKIISSTEIHNAPPPLEETREAFNSLLKLESGINIQDFGGWATLMAIISNDLFLNLKKECKNEERAMLSKTLLKKITRYYKNGKFIVKKTLEADFEKILQWTLIHCCDAYSANGGNFLRDENALSKELSAVDLLKLLENKQKQDSSGNAGIGAHKILNNQILNVHDFVLNPLRDK